MSSTTSDLNLLRRKLGALDYSPQLYVKEIAQRCVGGHELHQQRHTLNTLSEDTHSQLKKNVYQNYGQFIETAREIAFLESEMYQLSHMITDQRHLLTSLAETSLLGDKVPLSHEVGAAAQCDEKRPARSEYDEGRRKLYELLEKVESCSHVTDVPTRYLLHAGDLVEMDPAENAALHRVHGYLLNDGFMVATWLTNRRGPIRFKFSHLYELDSLAVVNVRDLGGIKHAFKLLVFPETRLFQCANAESKQTWMEMFESAKKSRQKQQESAALKRSNTLNLRSEAATAAAAGGGAGSSARGKGGDASAGACESSSPPLVGSGGNPFGDDFDEAAAASAAGGEEAAAALDGSLPEWLAELPDDLEVHIAQREFEAAVQVIARGKLFCAQHAPQSALVREAGVRLEFRTQQLIGVLKSEISADKSLQGGPRSARRAVQLLIKLGRSAQAAELFLSQRSALLHGALRAAKLDTATSVYVQRLATAFFSNVLETSFEFRKAFTSLTKKYSSFLVWLDVELDAFADKIDKQIFSPQTPLETIANCLEFIRSQCIRLQAEGLDILYLLDTRFRRNVERTICEHRDKHVEAVKLRAQEDKWEAINCFNKAGTERFLDEMAVAGIPSVRGFVYEECWVSLTRNTTSFSLSYLNFADALLKLFNASLRALVNESLVTVFHSHLRHIEQAVRASDKLKKSDPKFVQRNSAFLLDTLLSLIEHRYQEKTGSDCPKLGKLHALFSWLKETPSSSSTAAAAAAAPAQTPAAVTAKYTDPNYV